MPHMTENGVLVDEWSTTDIDFVIENCNLDPELLNMIEHDDKIAILTRVCDTYCADQGINWDVVESCFYDYMNETFEKIEIEEEEEATL